VPIEAHQVAGADCREARGAARFRCRPEADIPESNLGLLCKFQRIVQFDAQVTNSALNLGVSEKQLDSA
jgi:hypothetical protein